MIHRVLKIDRWVVDFLFAGEKYDIEGVLGCLYDAGAPGSVMDEAENLMRSCNYDCGFTYSRQYRFFNAKRHRAVVLIGPTSSGAELLDSFTHELYHLTVTVASEQDVKLRSEEPAYLCGDTARELADIIYELGCPHCNKATRRARRIAKERER